MNNMNPADRHQLAIAIDTVKHPMKALLGGPTAEQAEAILRDKFGYSDNRIYGLKIRGSGQRRRGEA